MSDRRLGKCDPNASVFSEFSGKPSTSQKPVKTDIV